MSGAGLGDAGLGDAGLSDARLGDARLSDARQWQLSISETADVMRLSQGAVKRYTADGLRRLRERLTAPDRHPDPIHEPGAPTG